MTRQGRFFAIGFAIILALTIGEAVLDLFGWGMVG